MICVVMWERERGCPFGVDPLRWILVRVLSCLESQGFQFDPIGLWSSLVLLPSPIAFSVIIVLLLAHSPVLYFPKSCLFER